jgi:hypothetical protein
MDMGVGPLPYYVPVMNKVSCLSPVTMTKRRGSTRLSDNIKDQHRFIVLLAQFYSGLRVSPSRSCHLGRAQSFT